PDLPIWLVQTTMVRIITPMMTNQSQFWCLRIVPNIIIKGVATYPALAASVKRKIGCFLRDGCACGWRLWRPQPLIFLASCHLPPRALFASLAGMLKKTLPFLLMALLAGCATEITNLTPRQQVRNQNNLYPVEVSLTSKQQNIRWDTVKPTVIVNGQPFE